MSLNSFKDLEQCILNDVNMSCILTDAFVSFRPAASHGADGSRRGSAVGWYADTNADHAGGADTDARTGTAESARREKTAYGLHLSKLQRRRKEVAKILFMKAFFFFKSVRHG